MHFLRRKHPHHRARAFVVLLTATLGLVSAGDAVVVNADSTTTFSATVAGPNLLTTRSPVAITAATDIGATLGAGAAGKFFQISGITADYAITLPLATTVGAGAVLGFSVAPIATANRQYTVSRAGSETLDGRTSLVLIHTNSLLLISTGVGWVSLTKKVDTDWVDGGPTTITATTTNPTKGTVVRDKTWWRRRGDGIEVRVEFEQSSAGTAGSGFYLIGVPGGFTIDLAKTAASNPGAAFVSRHSAMAGFGEFTGAGFSATIHAGLHVFDATRLWALGIEAAGASTSDFFWSTPAAGMTLAYSLGFNFSVPIVGW